MPILAENFFSSAMLEIVDALVLGDAMAHHVPDYLVRLPERHPLGDQIIRQVGGVQEALGGRGEHPFLVHLRVAIIGAIIARQEVTVS